MLHTLESGAGHEALLEFIHLMAYLLLTCLVDVVARLIEIVLLLDTSSDFFTPGPCHKWKYFFPQIPPIIEIGHMQVLSQY